MSLVLKSIVGRLKIIDSWEDMAKIEPGNLILAKVKEDLLVFILRAIDRGAIGFIGNYGSTHHGLIAARELGIPFYTTHQDNFREGEEYILNNDSASIAPVASSGDLAEAKEVYEYTPSRTKIFINFGFPGRTLARQPDLAKLADGVGFARLEFVILEIVNGIHPLAFMAERGHRALEDAIYEQLASSVAAFAGKDFWIRTDDFSPHQLRSLRFGERYERALGDELVGFRGVSRAINDEWLDLLTFPN